MKMLTHAPTNARTPARLVYFKLTSEPSVQVKKYSLLIDQQIYSEESENIICLDPYILNSFSYLDPISINVSQCMTSLLKLEITVSFLAFIASSFRVTEED